jgi:hypothetical protein
MCIASGIVLLGESSSPFDSVALIFFYFLVSGASARFIGLHFGLSVKAEAATQTGT